MSYPLLDDSRVQIVNQLSDHFEACLRTNQPQLHHIMGRPGAGKTAIAHEFYRRLAINHQAETVYWPFNIEPTARSYLHKRKRTYPDFSIPSDTPLPWMWWGLACQLDQGGSPVPAIQANWDQLQWHMNPLLQKIVRRPERIKNRLGLLFSFAGLLGGVNPLFTPLSLLGTYPGLEKEYETLRNAWKDKTFHQADITTEHLILTSQEELVSVLSATLVTVSQSLPVIVFVDDYQWADHTTASLVDNLTTAREGTIFVLVSSWPLTDLHQLRTSSSEEVFPTSAPATRLHHHALPPMSEASLARLSRRHAPNANPRSWRTAAKLAAGNPLLLRLALDQRLSDSEPVAILADLQHGSSSRSVYTAIKAGYEALWAGLPPTLKRPLALIAAHGGSLEEDDLLSALNTLNIPASNEEHINLILDTGWIRRHSSANRFSFSEPLLYHVASERVVDSLTRSELKNATDRAAERASGALSDQTWAIPAEEVGLLPLMGKEKLFQLQALVELVNNFQIGRVQYGELVGQAALAVARWYEGAFLFSQAVNYSRISNEYSGDYARTQEQELLAADSLVRNLIRNGNESEAIQLALARLSRSETPYGPLETRLLGYVAEGQKQSGGMNDALVNTALVWDRCAHLFGNHHPSTLYWIREHSAVLLQLGRIREARQYSEKAKDAALENYGHGDPIADRCLSDLAACLLHEGNYRKAAELAQQVLDRREAFFGENHPLTDTARGNRAVYAWAEGNYSLAAGMSLKTHRSRVASLGPRHFLTLRELSNLAWYYDCNGKVEAARRRAREAVRLRWIKLGEFHPDTLNSLSNFADILGHAGRWDKATRLHIRVLRGRRRILGSRHPSYVHSLHCTGNSFLETGRVVGAERVLRNAVVRREELLGSSHFRTLESAVSLGRALASTGDRGFAREILLMAHARSVAAHGYGHFTSEAAREVFGEVFGYEPALACTSCSMGYSRVGVAQ